MSNEKKREDFEAWVLSEYPNQHMGQFADGEYHSTTIQYCWLAWQASRAAVLVDLPAESDFAASDDAYFVLSQCRESIEASGLKVKP